MNLFGKKKQSAAAPKLSDAIQQLRDALSNLDKRDAHLSKQKEQCISQAKAKLAAKDKKGAMYHLKRAKLYDKQIEQITGKKFNIDTQIMALESAANNKDVFQVMQQGQLALNQAMKETDVDKVADVMDSINEAIVDNEEIGQQLSQQIGPIMDEDELNEELSAMEAELMDEQLLAAPSVPVASKVTTQVNVAAPLSSSSISVSSFPSVPERPVVSLSSSSSAPVSNLSQKEADELRELEMLSG